VTVTPVFRASGKEKDFDDYKKSRNAATATLRKARRKFEKNLASNIRKDSKSFFGYVRSKSKTKDVIGRLKNEVK